MIKIDEITKVLEKNNIEFISGVPDSIFKDLCLEFEKSFEKKHIVAANEGSSIGLAIGYHLASNKIPIVYLQNSELLTFFPTLIFFEKDFMLSCSCLTSSPNNEFFFNPFLSSTIRADIPAF